AAAVVAVAVSAAPTKAGLFPVSVSIQPEAGNFRWTYNVVLPTGMKLQSGDYFTIYDFGGYVPGSGVLSSPYPDDSAIASSSASAGGCAATRSDGPPSRNPKARGHLPAGLPVFISPPWFVRTHFRVGFPSFSPFLWGAPGRAQSGRYPSSALRYTKVK